MPILVGVASWTDKTLVECGRFYPKTTMTAEARLRFYATQFPLVEVDSSYYAIPAPATSQLWAERTPSDFTMNVKAFRIFTGHQTSPTVLHKDIRAALAPPKGNLFYKHLPNEIRDELWRRFIDALMPLEHAGKLGLVHFQFPPWVMRNAAGHAHVRQCVERMPGYTLAVEFRHKSWFDGDRAVASTLAFLRELGAVHTVVDGPQGFGNSVPAIWERTRADIALYRLHGRNQDTWNVKGAVSSTQRFNYDYAEHELAAMVPSVRALAAKVGALHIVFNNNMEDQGVRNAAMLRALLEG